MKNIKLFSTVLVLASLGAGTAIFAQAAVVNDATSKATLTAKAGNGGSDPVDPDDPTDPGKKTDPDKGNGVKPDNQTGALTIDYLSNLNFGTDIALTGRTVSANVVDETTRFFQVSDLRGTGTGWQLNVTLGDFVNGTKSIKGASITFKNGEVRSSNESQTEQAATVPVDDGSNQIKLSAGATEVTPMLKATAGNGRGTWLAAYPTPASSTVGNSNIVFSAPTTSIDANTAYTSTLTWQLQDSPSA